MDLSNATAGWRTNKNGTSFNYLQFLGPTQPTPTQSCFSVTGDFGKETWVRVGTLGLFSETVIDPIVSLFSHGCHLTSCKYMWNVTRPVWGCTWDWVGTASNCIMGLFWERNFNPVSCATSSQPMNEAIASQKGSKRSRHTNYLNLTNNLKMANTK